VTLDALVRGGLAEGAWRFFCDPNNQAHVDGAFEDEVLAELQATSSAYALPFNCRNTAPVVIQTQLITGADVGVARVGHGPQVEYRQAASKSDASALLDAELKRLRQEEIPATDVVVISLADDLSSSAALGTKAFAQRRLQAANEAGPDVVRLVSPSEFKGLEAPHVLVVDVNDIRSPGDRANLYVAMTRPRVSLWIVVGAEAWRQMAGEV
jgi:superfamily I DNA/RNA helicase